MTLEPNEDPEPRLRGALIGQIERLLAVARLLIDDGRFADDPLLEDRMIRDVNYLHGEMYAMNRDDGDWLGLDLGKIVGRIARGSLVVADIDDRWRPISDVLIGAIESAEPDVVVDAADHLVDALEAADPDWLAPLADFVEFADSTVTPRDVVGAVLGWVTPPNLEFTANAAHVGSALGALAGAVTSGLAGKPVIASAGAGGLVGALGGIAVVWFATAWRRRRRDPLGEPPTG